MKRRFLILLFFIFSSAIFGQHNVPRQKIMVSHVPSLLHGDGSRQKISCLPIHISDSTSDNTILASYDSLGSLGSLFPLTYVLSAKDSSRYLAMLVFNTFGRHILTRYYADGNYRSSASYNKQHQLNGNYVDYYKGGGRLKSIGKYRAGNKKGKWKYYNEEGKITKKEVYRNGVLKKSKEIKKPHRTYLTATANNYVPLDYKIIDETDTAKIVFAPDTIPTHHTPWALSTSLNYFQQDVGNLRKQPWMLNAPPDRSVVIGEELFLGCREKFFVSVGTYYGYNPTKTGPYQNYNAIHVSGFYSRYSALANFPVYKTKHTGLFLCAGAMWSTAFFYSEIPVNTGNPNAGLIQYFQNSKIKSGTLGSAALVFDWSHCPDHPNAATYFSLRVGYDFGFTDPKWFFGKTPTTADEIVSFDGLYVSLSMTLWRARR